MTATAHPNQQAGRDALSKAGSDALSRALARAARAVVLATALALLAACAGARGPATPAPGSDADHLRGLRLMVPVAGVQPAAVANTFDARRGDRRHEAVDLFAPRGTPVLAAVDGEILRVATNELGGRTIYATDRGRRFVYYYAHLDRYASRTKVGARVTQGSVIGYVGNSGNASAELPHLHFQVMRMIEGPRWWEGPPVNPHGFFARTGRTSR